MYEIAGDLETANNNLVRNANNNTPGWYASNFQKETSVKISHYVTVQ